MLNRILETANKHTDKLEGHVFRNVFKIPSDLVLPEDTVHDKECHRNEEIDEQLPAMLHNISKKAHTHLCLKEEVKSLNKAIMDYEQALNDIQLQESSAALNGVADWHDTMSYNVQKTVQLLELMEEESNTDTEHKFED